MRTFVTFVLISAVGLVLFMTEGCDIPERISRLEKETQELKAQVSKDRAATSAVAEYDLQAKCSRDANGWFKEHWGSGDKDTILLDERNHYNKSSNKCFVFVEYHYSLDKSGSWVNDMSLWDVYENVKYGDFGENHMIYRTPKFETKKEVITCALFDKKCTTVEEFNGLVRPYLNN